jgi:hippurate hydrolase
VDRFDLTVECAGCHGTSLWSCVEPIVVGAQTVTALKVMVARGIDVNHNAVVTVGTFHAGTAPNVIPERAELKATVRNGHVNIIDFCKSNDLL